MTVALMLMSVTAVAQVTTSGINGLVMASGEEVIGATITAKHIPSGAVYRGVTNISGRYAIDGMRAGGPYEVEVSYIGYQTQKFTDLQLSLGQNAVLDVTLLENSEVLQEVVVVSAGRSNMRTDRAGSVTSVNAGEMAVVPTVGRSLNDIMKLTPTGANTGNGFAVGGGNFRQSYVTIDGAAFNNAFGIGGNLPGGGSPVSLDALEQVSVSTSPFDVRQSGFTGGAINAVTLLLRVVLMNSRLLPICIPPMFICVVMRWATFQRLSVRKIMLRRMVLPSEALSSRISYSSSLTESLRIT